MREEQYYKKMHLFCTDLKGGKNKIFSYEISTTKINSFCLLLFILLLALLLLFFFSMHVFVWRTCICYATILVSCPCTILIQKKKSIF